MKLSKKILLSIGCLLGLVLLLFIIDYLRLNISYQINKDSYEEAFDIVGNKDGYVPQGMAYDSKHDIILQTSYNGNGKISKLYIINYNNKELVKEMRLFKADGTENHLHVGGVATDGKTVWITSDYQVNEYLLEDILSSDNDFIGSSKEKKLPIRGDFCYFDGSYLWIGDFFLKPFYPVPNDTPLLLKYSLKGLDYNKPDLAASLPKMVQGMTITNKNEFVFTRSFTYLIKSDLATYKNIFNNDPDTYNLKGHKIPYYHFTKKELIKSEKLPPMAEGLFYKNKNLYILFESSSDHYGLALPKVKKVIKKSTID